MDSSEFSSKVYSFIKVSAEVKTAEEFNTLIRVELRKALPHAMTAYGVLLDDHRSLHMVNIDFPEDFINRVISTPAFCRTIVMNQLERREPEFYSVNQLRVRASHTWANAARDNNIRNIAWYGALDLASHFTTYFTFSQFEGNSTSEIKHGLCMIVPYLHSTLSNILACSKTIFKAKTNDVDQASVLHDPASRAPAKSGQLSTRETEVLMWLYYGKTNSEIASILNTSVFTVKNHVQNILVKLGANNRTHAIMQAARKGLLHAGAPKLRNKSLVDPSADPLNK